ncbi:hypothetical protein FFK22_040075 [Mycobacterium sp. KBS0706]|uniref:hypothetical protein n=1 Tax=Mycobacterium sp. KBS0706 TaxID=2578109 RepID=UPI00110FEBA4|nr:hypothetical protein [Mycobacterium sp. KBS0706]TSD82996.1 hypothetical protein FFK22_040075 [Mycobacterium sp. KBS0706]
MVDTILEPPLLQRQAAFTSRVLLGRLRHQTFFSLAEANQAIAAMLDRLNGKVKTSLKPTRSSTSSSTSVMQASGIAP